MDIYDKTCFTENSAAVLCGASYIYDGMRFGKRTAFAHLQRSKNCGSEYFVKRCSNGCAFCNFIPDYAVGWGAFCRRSAYAYLYSRLFSFFYADTDGRKNALSI